jgi:hypothetical protein
VLDWSSNQRISRSISSVIGIPDRRLATSIRSFVPGRTLTAVR